MMQVLRPVVCRGGSVLIAKLPYPNWGDVKRAPMEWAWLYRMYNCRNSSELLILLRILEHCLDITSMQPQGAYPVIRSSRPAADYRYTKEYEVKFSPNQPSMWCHEDDVELWAIRTYGHHIVYAQRRSEEQQVRALQQRALEEKKKV